LISKLILIMVDLIAILLSISIAYQLRCMLNDFFVPSYTIELKTYLTLWPTYVIIFILFFYEGLYTRRYDFWHESRQIIKALFFSFLLLMAVLALTKISENYSRFIIITAFLIMAFLIPLFKNFTKKTLFKIGLWAREAKIYGNDPFIKKEIFKNPYLGYIEVKEGNPKTVFINSEDLNPSELQEIINKEVALQHEVIFIPLMNMYNLTQSIIYELSNTRTNLILFQNRLKSRYRIASKQLFNYLLALLLLPVLLPVIGIIAILIKRESPGPVFFAHNRIGKGGKTIPVLKFRSMYADAKERLEKLLSENPAIKEEWEKNFKLKNDPRVTKIGAFLRKTSLDELPQIFNVIKGEMSFVGPRPVVQEEIDKYYKEDAEYYFMVKPGITGLWQVSGRSDTDYDFRIKIDKWYVINWSLWLDIVILIKTIKTVLSRKGAY